MPTLPMKEKAMLIIFLLLITSLTNGFSQSSFIPKNPGTEINSIYDEIAPLIAPDGKTLYFTRLNHPENSAGVKNSADTWVSVLKPNGTWSTAQRVTSLSTGKYNLALSLSGDGNQLLVNKDNELFIYHKDGENWGTPEKVKAKASKEATLSADGKYLLFSKGSSIVILEKTNEGTWSNPITIKLPGVKKIETPFLLADNKTLFFSSNTKGKQTDVYKVTRTGNDWMSWSTSVALNDTINSIQSERWLKTNSIGSWAYFSSSNNSFGKADIFRVKLYEDNPFVEVSGKVINAVSKRPLRNKTIIFFANGNPVDSVKINKDSASFQIKLPFGKNYSVTAQIDHYTPYAFNVDATALKEFTAVSTYMEEAPGSYILLKGKLLIKNTDKTIPASAKSTIVVDGETIDSAQIDYTAGTYTLRLNHGSAYYIQVSAKRFESFPEMLDLTTQDGYEEITLDLQADAEKMAIVTGKIIDQETGTSLSSNIPMSIKVEGIESLYASIDSLTANYDLRLPLRERYVISVRGPEYYPVYETIDVTNNKEETKIKQDLIAVPIKRGNAVLLKNLFFASRQSTLLPESNQALDRLVEFLNNNPDVKIELGGYSTRSVKTSTLNAAKAVQKYLIAKGVSSMRVTARGHGSVKGDWDGLDSQTLKVEFVFLN